MTDLHDDLGHPVRADGAARRVVSLVPSLTESLADTAPDRAGRRHRLVHPPGGPRRARVAAPRTPMWPRSSPCGPTSWWPTRRRTASRDLRRAPVEPGVPVWVTGSERWQALASLRPDLRRWSSACPSRAGSPPPDRAWPTRGPPAYGGRRSRSGVNRGWSSGATPSRGPPLGARRPQRLRRPRRALPEIALPDLLAAGADLVLLPDEPYVFTADDGPEVLSRDSGPRWSAAGC